MNSLYNINNENLGYKVASYDKFVAVGNPNTKQYDVNEGFSRTGEVLLYYKNPYENDYVLVKSFEKPYLETLISTVSYAPAISASNYESGSYNHNNYGKSFDISSKYLAIGDSNFLQKIYYYTSSIDNIESTSSINLSSVEIYEFSRTSSVGDCTTLIDDEYVLSNLPIYSITSSNVNDEYGYSVSISNNYLLVGAPGTNNGSGSVYLYQKQSGNTYSLITNITSSVSDYTRFGASLSLDKLNEDRFIVGSDSRPNKSVFVYKKSGNDWNLYQTLTKTTSSIYQKVDGSDFNFYPLTQSNSRFGYSVGIENNLVVVGDPNDLIYYEYSGSNKIRERGSFYVYDVESCIPSSSYKLLTKSYGTNSTFKDNMLGFDVSINNSKIAISSPKPYFPFSSLYLSGSIGTYNKFLEKGDLGESSFNGQVLFYEYNNGILNKLTDLPINYRKNINEPYSAFGRSVSVSSECLVVGSPIPLNDDLYLNTPILIEQSASAPTSCSNSVVDIFSIIVEDEILNEDDTYVTASLILDEPEIPEMTGRSFIYDFTDLKTNYVVGNVFYNNAKLVINNSGSITKDILRDPTDSDKSYVHMGYNSDISFHEKQFICTVEPGEFNISTNPSALNFGEFEWNVFNREKFEFKNLDIILRYINSKITISGTEYWYNSFVDTSEKSIFDFYTNSESNFSSSVKLTDELKCQLSNLNFDVNGDGTVNSLDGTLIWKYFAGTLNSNNYRNYITNKSSRKTFDEIISFLNDKSGKNKTSTVKEEFFDYKKNSENDITGSYLAPYITQIGLYSGTDLVAIAKLAHPIKNTGEIPINIAVKWDI